MSSPVSQLPYEPVVYDKLEGPDDAYKKFCSLSGEQRIMNDLKAIFCAHEMWDCFGLTLLHRHFPMSDDERLVAVDGVSVPWTVEIIEQVNEGSMVPGGSVVAQAFILDAGGNGFYPFEYSYIGQDSEKVHPHVPSISLASAPLAFLKDIGEALVKFGLEELLGLRAHPGSLTAPRLEFTSDRANITVPIKDFSELQAKTIPTSWYFQNPKQVRCSSRCTVYCNTNCVRLNGCFPTRDGRNHEYTNAHTGRRGHAGSQSHYSNHFDL
ncbi:Major facilitator superfamily domain, general substrate transporter [Mycena sanguinolenta]|uniref:Major facilitator superfamily domain, general substrate transporter n=1 Tax=Mycena sanguinolenta TaxID=230812 RepID=A0A8H6XU02_9AGAR|nr:Major facilitator superfamily domain, general substrate transporter [Mycena sanguinolenta]